MSSYKNYTSSDNNKTGSVSTAAFRPSYSIASGTYKAPKTTESVSSLLNKYAPLPKATKAEDQDENKNSKTPNSSKTKDQKLSHSSVYRVDSNDQTNLKNHASKVQVEKRKKEDGPPVTYNRVLKAEVAQPSNVLQRLPNKSSKYDRTSSLPYINNREPSPAQNADIPNSRSSFMIRDSSRTSTKAPSRDPSPSFRSSYYEKARSRDPSPDHKMSSIHSLQAPDTRYRSLSREVSPAEIRKTASLLLSNKDPKVYSSRSRDPSPDLRRTSYIGIEKTRSREPSPAEVKRNIYFEEMKKADAARSKLTEAKKSAVQEFLLEKKAPPVTYKSTRSREPSPSPLQHSRILPSVTPREIVSKLKTREPSPASTKASNGISSYLYSTDKKTTSDLPVAVSYLSAGEFRARSHPRTISEHSKLSSDQYERTNQEIQQISKQIEALCNGNETESETESSSSEMSTTDKEESPMPQIMVKVNVVQRGTSPTHPSLGSKIRRQDAAKTIEKTITRSFQRPKMLDKGTQSDRMDDTTRSRYLTSTAYSPTPYRNYSSRSSTVSNGSSRRYVSSSSSEKTRNEEDHKYQPKMEISVLAQNEFEKHESNENSSHSLTQSKSSSKPSPEIKQGSQIPIKSGTPPASTKPANKDFRKSVLNMGSSADSRKKKSVSVERSSSTESDSNTSVTSAKNSKARSSQRTSVSIDEIPADVSSEKNGSSFLMRAFASAPKYEFRKKTPPEDCEWLGSCSDIKQEQKIEDQSNEIEGDGSTLLENGHDSADDFQGDEKLNGEVNGNEGAKDFWSDLNKNRENSTEPRAQLYTYFPPCQEPLQTPSPTVQKSSIQILPGAPGHLNIVYGSSSDCNGHSLELGDRASPEGLEAIKPHTEVNQKIFISRHENIDEILGGGGQLLAERITDFECFQEIFPDQVKIHVGTSNHNSLLDNNANSKQLDDATIQVYKDGDYGNYLDLEASLAEQLEEIEGLRNSRRNSLVIRTQLSVRVHSIIDKLYKAEGRELRRALFTLKQIFQEDKDLVHGFVALGGLNCLMKIGKNADQNHQNYILRALGQVMLYVDGMTGVMQHRESIEWLYALISSKYRLVVKTSLKLLLVFVEYCESNCYSLVNAIRSVDRVNGCPPWSNIMGLLKDNENADTELLIYATTLINKTLSGLRDQDSFFDETDFLEHQGMEGIIQRYMSRPGTDLDLLDQLQLYELVLRFEDGDIEQLQIPDNTVRTTHRQKSTNGEGRRKSYRHSSDGLTMNPAMVRAEPYLSHPNDMAAFRSPNDQDHTCLNNGSYQECAPDDGFKPNLKPDCDNTDGDKLLLEQLKRDQNVKDITQKLNNLPMSPTQEEKSASFVAEGMVGLISKAKEELSKTKSRTDIQIVNGEANANTKKVEQIKKSETDLQWEELVNNLDRDLRLCDLDFTDLTEADDDKSQVPKTNLGLPPPPPPIGGIPVPKLPFLPPVGNSPKSNDFSSVKKNKKTVKLFWKEVREDMPTSSNTIWDELPNIDVDTNKLEHLFESRAKDLLTKEKQQEFNKNKEIVVLDHKRSNAINIAITKLPPSRAIKAAIMKMDSTVVNREGIEKLLGLLPTEEEKGKIQEAQLLNPDLPLGSAEQFLLTLSTIPELSSRLKLWAFKFDFENIEKDIAEPLMDLKQGVQILRTNETFKHILATLRSIGIFLNGNPVKGFQIDYLSKVPEVKDTVQKHSLLHHLCHFVMESAAKTSDLYSEIGPITRASKADFTDLAHNIAYLEAECKASWDRLRLISKHEISTQLKQKLFEFLTDSAERIIMLSIIHRRVLTRFKNFLLWLGISPLRLNETRPNDFCRIISEFALEYRTTRERVQQQIEKRVNHRERNKTRGKLIIDIEKARGSTMEDKADAELRQLLGTPNSSTINTPEANLTWRRRKADSIIKVSNESFMDGDDELLETLVKTATKVATPRTTPRERKRTRNVDRKSLRRTLKNGLSEDEKMAVAAFNNT